MYIFTHTHQGTYTQIHFHTQDHQAFHLRYRLQVWKFYVSHLGLWSTWVNGCERYKVSVQIHFVVCGCLLFPAQFVEKTILSPLSILNVTAGARPALLLGQRDLQCEKGKPKSPSNENIKVNASQVRNLLPLTPINSYKTLVLSCPCAGTQTLDFIKLNFLFFFTRPVMCVWTNHHLLLSGLVHFPGL